MAVEARSYTPEFSSAKLEQLRTLRKSIFETQIRPVIAAKTSWLAFKLPATRGAELSSVQDQAGGVAQILNRLDDDLAETITLAENEPTSYGAYYLPLCDSPSWGGRLDPAAPNYHSLKKETFDRAIGELFAIIQNEVPLRTDYSWDDIMTIYQGVGKHMPPLPEGLIYVGGQDDGIINDRISVNLPTKVPFIFLNYTFRLWGRWEGSNQDNPVRPESLPDRISIMVIALR